jgi:hypothetical protein
MGLGVWSDWACVGSPPSRRQSGQGGEGRLHRRLRPAQQDGGQARQGCGFRGRREGANREIGDPRRGETYGPALKRMIGVRGAFPGALKRSFPGLVQAQGLQVQTLRPDAGLPPQKPPPHPWSLTPTGLLASLLPCLVDFSRTSALALHVHFGTWARRPPQRIFR